MSLICPTILATDIKDYRAQLERVTAFAERIQVDLTDGTFTSNATVALTDIWLPDKTPISDIHLMYQQPAEHIDALIALQPNMVIVHIESDCDIPLFAAELRQHNIKTGVAILPETALGAIDYVLPHVQHALIFSGKLGFFGGNANIGLLERAGDIKKLAPHIEIGWDGGANPDNCQLLAEGGVDVINVGGAIQKADDPETTYAKMKAKVTSVGIHGKKIF